MEGWEKEREIGRDDGIVTKRRRYNGGRRLGAYDKGQLGSYQVPGRVRLLGGGFSVE